MSVLIKGMEMPTNCFLCPLSVLNGERLFCEVTKDEVIRAKRSSCCPLCLVPPHGRLIDADATYDSIAEVEHAGNYVDMDAVGRGIDDTPTIIPADKDGET